MKSVQIRQMVHANINVRDMEKTVPFYEMLGFEKFADQIFGDLAGLSRLRASSDLRNHGGRFSAHPR